MDDMEDDDDGSSADSPKPKDTVEKYEGEDFEKDRDAANLHDGFSIFKRWRLLLTRKKSTCLRIRTPC